MKRIYDFKCIPILRVDYKLIVYSIFFLFLFQIKVCALCCDMKEDIPRDTTFTITSAYNKELKNRPFIKMAKSEFTNSIFFADSLIYSQPGKERDLYAKIFRPDDKKLHPAIILVHGGGWSSGNFTMEIPLAMELAKCGYVTILIEYRLSPEAIYPAAVYDLKTAVRWTKANTKSLDIDSTKIAILGCSSGGQLATLIGTTNGQNRYELKDEYSEYSSVVQAVVNIDGICTFVWQPNIDNVQKDYEKNKLSASVRWLGGTFGQAKSNWVAASSIYHITDASAPICFINSSIDRFHDGRDEYIELLNQHGIYSTTYTLQDTPHTFWLFEPWFKPTVTYITDFLNKIFNH